MNEEKAAKLLGRPLTTLETNNFDLYLEIATESLEELLCISLVEQPDDSTEPVEETRVFDIRDGYSTVFTDIFTELTEVKVDDVVETDYYKAFWDKRVNPFYNSIVLDSLDGRQVSIKGYWGFAPLPNDLQRLLAQLFAEVSKKYKAGSGRVKSKRVEDFSVTYSDLTDDEVFINANARTIRKYSMCNIGYVKSGEVC